MAGLATLSGPLQNIYARSARVGSTGVPPNNGGYGPLAPGGGRDRRGGPPAPARSRVRQHHADRHADGQTGVLTPAATTAWPRSTRARKRYRLVRNHEINGPVSAFGDRAKAYDTVGGGTTTLEVNRSTPKGRSS